MKKSRGRDCFDLPLFAHTEALREFKCIDLYTSNVTMCDLVLCVDGHGQSFDRRHVQFIDLSDVLLSILHPTKRRSVC